ncbi:MAG: heavy metal translocating P-type ATPase [Betaproteobacteria bacterium]|nr:heavy metal translocating P-type ATPase [Betaproteobacteria bacterium]
MDYATEEALLRKALQGLPGVLALDFNLMERTLKVSHTLADPKPITDAIAALDMAPVLQSSATHVPPRAVALAPAISRKQWTLMTVAGVAATGSEAVAYATGDETSLVVGVLAVVAILAGGLKTLKKGWIALKTFSLNMNLLMSVAAIGAALIGEWPEAAVVIWLFGLAEMIEALSLDRARNAIRSLMTLAPESASVRQPDGFWRETSADAVPVGAIVRVRPGERIALDGVVETGRSSVNQAPITGESMPVEKQPGDPVFAGTINERGAFEFRVSAPKGETMLDRIARSVQEAQAQRAPTQRFVDQFAHIYTPAVFLIAILVALVPPLAFGQPWYDWIYKALVLLVIACPCALVISTPVTVVSGLAAAARRGILVKGGLYLEQGRRLKSIAFDKTGTITHGKPVLTHVVPFGGMTRAEALRIAASLDALSEHPVAAAIVDGYGDKPHAGVTGFEALTGYGVKGDIDGNTYYIGNHRLVEQLRICNPGLEEILDRLEADAKTAVVLATKDELLAVLAVADTVRDHSREAVTALKAFGVTPVMLTGDNIKTAEAIATQVGITETHGELLPQDKLAVITKLLERGPAGMAGDGVNDAPALARASIGFAMGAAGTDTAIETADVALMRDDLRMLPEFIALSRRTEAVLWQNIVFAIGVKVLFFVLTFAGYASLWLAVFADMGASLIVVFNGLRILRLRRGAHPQRAYCIAAA